MRYKWTIRCAILFSLIVIFSIGILRLIPSREEAVFRRTEEIYHEFVESKSTQLFSHYPEIFDRISLNKRLASRIVFVHLFTPETDGDYSALSLLPNVEELVIAYAYDVSALVPAINRMPSLKQATFAYCDLTDKTDDWIAKLKNPSLENLKIHGYQTRLISDEELKACQSNMPNCTIAVTDDGDE